MKKAKVASLVLVAGCVSQGYAAWWNPVSWFRSAKPAEPRQTQDSVPEEPLCATPPDNPSLSGSAVYSYTNFHLDAQDAYGYSIKWNSLGPVAKRDQAAGSIATGKVTEIIPLSSTRILAGMQGSGVWRTLNANAVDAQGKPAVTWSPLDQNMASLSTKSVAVNPRNTSQIMVGTGMAAVWLREGNAAGIQYSSNGGSTWTQLPFFQSPMPNGQWVSAVNSILAVRGSGTITRWIAAIGSIDEANEYNPNPGMIMQSIDNGATWSEAIINVPQGQTKYNYREIFSLVEVKGATKTILYGVANTTDGNRIALLRSDDSGKSWAQRSTVVAPLSQQPLRIAASAANPDRVYFVGAYIDQANKISTRIVYRSTDGGNTLQEAARISLTQGYASKATSIWVDPLNPDVVVVGGTTLARSMDGGVTFQEMVGYNNELHPDVWALTGVYGYSSTNRGLLVGTDGGMWRIKDVRATPWVVENFSEGMSTLFATDISVAPDHAIALSTWDNGTWRKQPGSDWGKIRPGDGQAVAYASSRGGWYCLGADTYNKTGITFREKEVLPKNVIPYEIAFGFTPIADYINGEWISKINRTFPVGAAGAKVLLRSDYLPQYNGIYDILDFGSSTSKFRVRRSRDFDEIKPGEMESINYIEVGGAVYSLTVPAGAVVDQTVLTVANIMSSTFVTDMTQENITPSLSTYKDGSVVSHSTYSVIHYVGPSKSVSVPAPFGGEIFSSRFNPHNGDLWVAGAAGNMGYFERYPDPNWVPNNEVYIASSPKAINNNGWISTSIEFDPLNPKKVYMTMALAPNSVWAKEDYEIYADDNTYSGWKCIGGIHNGMANLWVNHISVHPLNPDMLFVGTKVGMMVSFDGGRTWGQKNVALNRWVIGNEGPGNAEIRKMQFVGDTLYLGTYGRGVWQAKIPTYPNVF